MNTTNKHRFSNTLCFNEFRKFVKLRLLYAPCLFLPICITHILADSTSCYPETIFSTSLRIFSCRQFTTTNPSATSDEQRLLKQATEQHSTSLGPSRACESHQRPLALLLKWLLTDITQRVLNF